LRRVVCYSDFDSPMIRPVWRKAKAAYKRYAKSSVFEHIYENNLWGDAESVSGSGSNLAGTAKVRGELPHLISTLGVASMLDAPCGDFHWMKDLKIGEMLRAYYGVDIVRPLIAENQRKYASDTVKFLCLDVVKDALPRADLILCRHLLIHLCLTDSLAVIRNFKKSGAKFLLITTQEDVAENREILFTGSFRPLNIERPPFSLPPRIMTIDDSHGKEDQSRLGLYRLADIKF
jgi:hypothetical protein